ncbi:NUDIX hydrolase [Desulfospira joergensenii]|uniref:NUDIX hydrolase n=1 Tax=Desulfospira joergensenii TaxID=53329 RepID=UPI0003B40D58|nr:NUDIX hydrolase [Desulfospira joergensenii]
MLNKNNPKEYPNRPALAVGAVVFKEDRILLVQRGNPPAKGVWAIPGGSVELGETLKQAVQREILEETGIRIRAGEPVYSFESIERDRDGKIRYHYYIVDFEAEYLGGEIRAGDDAEKAEWVSADQLDRMEINPKTRDLLRNRYDFG